MAEIDVAPLEELPPGTMKLVELDPSSIHPASADAVSIDPVSIGVYNCNGELLAIEDRCTHDDGPLALGNWDPEACTVFCPRHGASFDLRSGKALTLPAYLPARTFPVRVEDGIVKLDAGG